MVLAALLTCGVCTIISIDHATQQTTTFEFTQNVIYQIARTLRTDGPRLDSKFSVKSFSPGSRKSGPPLSISL